MRTWLLAIRPKTLWAAVAPVALATVLAFDAKAHHWLSAVGCLVLGLIVQISTNLINDYYDFLKGADTEERIGPTRVMQAGLVKPEAMRRVIWLVCLAGVLVGGLLTLRGGWPMLSVCVVGLICGYLYTGGPYPLGYIGLADVFVLVFFGPVAVGATYYVQALSLPTHVLLMGLAPGLISTAILTVNNLRDIEGDSKVGKRTLAVRFGRRFAMAEYLTCLLVAAVGPGLLAVMTGSGHHFLWVALLLLPLAGPVIAIVLTRTDGPGLNGALASTGKLLVLHTLLLSIGWIL